MLSLCQGTPWHPLHKASLVVVSRSGYAVSQRPTLHKSEGTLAVQAAEHLEHTCAHSYSKCGGSYCVVWLLPLALVTLVCEEPASLLLYPNSSVEPGASWEEVGARSVAFPLWSPIWTCQRYVLKQDKWLTRNCLGEVQPLSSYCSTLQLLAWSPRVGCRSLWLCVPRNWAVARAFLCHVFYFSAHQRWSRQWSSQLQCL